MILPDRRVAGKARNDDKCALDDIRHSSSCNLPRRPGRYVGNHGPPHTGDYE
jgi:hypothetical protein